MARTEIAEIEMPDGSVINAEVVVADSITDVGIRDRLRAEPLKGTIEAFIRWAVGGLDLPGQASADAPQPDSSPGGMELSRLGVEFGVKLTVKAGALTSVLASAGGEATATVRLEWERGARGEMTS